MSRRVGRSDRPVTVALIVALAIMGAILVRRELFATKPVLQSPRSSQYVADWRRLVPQGVVLGRSDAPVSIVEFFDLQCPSCRAEHEAIKNVHQRFGDLVSLVLIPFPLPHHPFARQAYFAFECARKAGVADAMLDVLYQQQDSLGVKPWKRYGLDAGVRDTANFGRCVATPDDSGALEAGQKLGRQYAIDVTPTVIVNGWRFAGAVQEASLLEIVGDLLAGRSPSWKAFQLTDPPVAVVSNEQAGVTVVRYDSAAFRHAEQYSLSPEPFAVAGGAGSAVEYDLTRVSSAAFLSDGRIAAFASRESRMFIFTSDGGGQRTFGGIGQAPGQFMRADFTVLKGDTLAFVDAGIRRVTRMTPEAKVIATKAISGPLPGSGGQLSGALPGRRFVLNSAGIIVGIPDSASQNNASVSVLSEQGEAREILTVPDLRVATLQTRFRSSSRPGSPRVVVPFRFAVPARIIVWDTLIAVASPDRYRIARHDAAGRLVSLIQVSAPRRPVTPAMRTAEIVLHIALLHQPGHEPARDMAESERIEHAVPFVDSLPPYSDILVSPDKTLWVVDAIAPGDTSWSATAFRLDGTIMKRLRAPMSGTPIAFGNDRVLVKRADADGIISLEVHQIRAPQGRGRR